MQQSMLQVSWRCLFWRRRLSLLQAVTVSYKDKLDLSIGVAVGSSIQIALFVIPVLVLVGLLSNPSTEHMLKQHRTQLGWALGKPLSLLFDPFESVTLFLAVLLAQSTMADARSNWLEGYLLMMVYVIIAVRQRKKPTTR